MRQSRAVWLRDRKAAIEKHKINYIDICRRLDLLKAELKTARTQIQATIIIGEMKFYKRVKRDLETKSKVA